MLDSLVRVSRRVGWGADRLARDPEQVRESRTTAQQAVSEHCEQSTQVERATRGRGPSRGGCSSVRECGRLRPVPKNAPAPERAEATLDKRFIATLEPVLADTHLEKAPSDARRHAGPSTRIGHDAPRTNGRLNSKGKLVVPSVYL